MKQRFLSRILLATAFAAGLVAPLAATQTSSAQAFTSCSPISGSDSWTGSTAGGGSYTVSVAYDTGVSVTGTPPPLASLPVRLTSTSGHHLAISADAAGARVYEGDFSGQIPQSCSCENMACEYWTNTCVSNIGTTCLAVSGGGCVTGSCSGGSCSGGACTASFDFKAAF